MSRENSTNTGNIAKFVEKWTNEDYSKASEKRYTQSFWLDFLINVCEIENATDYIKFEKPVDLEKQSYIDCYLPSAKVIIEQKSKSKSLDKKYTQSSGEMLTPYEQADRYDAYLNYDDKAKYIITCNFDEFNFVLCW
jgi:hypothetical protein